MGTDPPLRPSSSPYPHKNGGFGLCRQDNNNDEKTHISEHDIDNHSSDIKDGVSVFYSDASNAEWVNPIAAFTQRLRDYNWRNASVLQGGSRHIAASIRRATFRPRLFLNVNGYLGLGPDVLRPGDQVVILSSAPVPFILRGKDAGRPYLKGNDHNGKDIDSRRIQCH
jgi:hypothetical protein